MSVERRPLGSPFSSQSSIEPPVPTAGHRLLPVEQAPFQPPPTPPEEVVVEQGRRVLGAGGGLTFSAPQPQF